MFKLAAFGLFILCPFLLCQEVMAGDPTKPKAGYDSKIEKTPQSKVKKKDTKALRLESVLIGRNSKFAIINSQKLTLGQRIRGYKLETISGDYVILKSEKKTIKLSLFNVSAQLKIEKNGTN